MDLLHFCTLGMSRAVLDDIRDVGLDHITFSGGIRLSIRVVWMLPEPSDSKIWSLVLWDSEPRITVMAREAGI
jgi:hypothetical protein